MKAKYPTKSRVLKERSDVDPHKSGQFDPEELGMEDWGDGFFVNPEPVVIERGPDQEIVRTTPISEASPEQLFPGHFKEGELIKALPNQPIKKLSRPKEQVVEMLAGLLMHYYSKQPPGLLAFNPLYDGIPADVALGDNYILQPNLRGDQLVHVSAHEVHQWLKQLIARRAKITTQGASGYRGDISDLMVTLSR
jgi:hypothetical protein